MRTILSLLAFGAAALALAPSSALADAPGRHPAYLHARSDLRAAQLYMRRTDDPNVNRHLREADREVEAAIHELDQASLLDAKDLNDHPHTDEAVDRPGRFHRMVDLLRSARRDLGHPEDNLSATGWRDAAYRHIDLALDNLHKAAVELAIDKELGF
jgi:hypothetical protein